jgi:hypothetical protein
MEEVEEGGSWKKLKKWSHGRSLKSGVMEEVGSWKKLKKRDGRNCVET